MSITEVKLPAMGEGITDATITKWLVKEGDMVDVDTPIVEIATDKVDSEVPSPVSGRVVKLLLSEGDIPKIGQVVAIIEANADSNLGLDVSPATPAQVQPAARPVAEAMPAEEPMLGHIPSRLSNGTFVPPLVRKIATEEGVSLQELESIKGSGIEGKLTKNDIIGYLDRDKEPQPEVKPQAASSSVEIIEMDRLRKLTASHMVQSKQTSAHVTSFIEVDMTSIVQWRERNKVRFEQVNGEKITFTPFFFSAVVDAIKAFPLINSSVEGSQIHIKKDINIGMATALPNDNLIVPVVRNADRLNLAGLAYAVNDLARRARASKLQPAEVLGGTFTISNLGAFDNLAGTPIINQPQVAILAVGSIKKRPVVVESPQGDSIGIRHMAILSLTFDHRIIDGALGGTFLKRIATNLEGYQHPDI